MARWFCSEPCFDFESSKHKSTAVEFHFFKKDSETEDCGEVVKKKLFRLDQLPEKDLSVILMTHIEFILRHNFPFIIQAIDVHTCFKQRGIDRQISIRFCLRVVNHLA